MSEQKRPPRALRGLVLGFVLSFLNLAGAFLAIMALGGLGAWTGWQFIGLFGLIETATGFAFIICPNIWRLPVAEANTSDRTSIRVAASTILMPHWAALAKIVAGLGMVVAAAARTSVTLATIGAVAFVLLLAAAVIALSLLAARVGVARPDLDVVHVVIQRPGHDDAPLPGITIGGMIVQLINNIGAFPAVKLMPPSLLYQPELAPSRAMLSVLLAVAALLTLAAYAAWHDRITWHAPREQQREAEEMA